MLLFLGLFVFLQAGFSGQALAQSLLQHNVITGLSCAPSNNGSGHMICSGDMTNPNGGTPVLAGVSWQAPNGPAKGATGANGAPVEASGTVDQMTSIEFPNGPFTGTPSCAFTNDDTGTAICAVEGTTNGLYGIAIHPQPVGPTLTAAQTTSALVPLLLPGAVITTGTEAVVSPCNTKNPCNRVGAIASPSCANTEGAMVICAVVVLMQNTIGAAETDLVGIAFDPRAAQVAGSNPAITLLPIGTGFHSDPSCTSDVDLSHTNPVDGGHRFAACAIVFNGAAFGATATLFGFGLDPRSGYATTSAVFSAPGGMSFTGDPSCATPRDNSSEVICAIGVGVGTGFGSGTSSTLLGLAFNPVSGTSSTLNLGAPPSADGSWSGVSCASPNGANDTNSVACAATTSGNEVLAINFDPRTGLDPITKAAPVFSGNVFTDANGLSINPTPSCISLNVIMNQITCGIVDGAGNAMGFVVPITH
jgi:hypothetical protein